MKRFLICLAIAFVGIVSILVSGCSRSEGLVEQSSARTQSEYERGKDVKQRKRGIQKGADKRKVLSNEQYLQEYEKRKANEQDELRELWLRGTHVTDKGIRHLKGLSKLESLLISRTSLSDAGLTIIKNLASLKSLDISSTNVTDADVLELKKLKNLKYLNLYDTKTTPKGISELAKVMPGLQINTKAPPRRSHH